MTRSHVESHIRLELHSAETDETSWARDPMDASRRYRVSPHFTPRVEEVEVAYRIAGLGEREVRLQVFSATQEEAVFERPLSLEERADGDDKVLHWDGRLDQAHSADPVHAPYRLRLLAGPELATPFAEVDVLVHSVVLRRGAYTANGEAPDRSDTLRWVQYSLNELGWFAGPVDGEKGEQTIRALRRYTFATAGLEESDDETEPRLLRALEEHRGHRELFADERCLEGDRDSAVYVDHDYFYQDLLGDFFGPDRHVKLDREKLDPFEVPIEAEVLLVGRDDHDGTGPGVRASGACDGLELEWSTVDTPQDVSVLPAHTTTEPSQARAYVARALAAVASGGHNCPPDHGGLESASSAHFRSGASGDPYRCRVVEGRVLSDLTTGSGTEASGRARTGVWFRGSHVAGDRFVVRARVATDRLPRGELFEQRHRDFHGRNPLDASTGAMTIWRRHHLAALVGWPPLPKPVDVEEVAEAFRAAHCDLDTDHSAVSAAELLATEELREAYLSLVLETHPGWRREDLSFGGEGIYPRAIPARLEGETHRDYTDKVDALIEDFMRPAGSLAFIDGLAAFLRRVVGETRGAGAIVLHANFAPPVDSPRSLPIAGRSRDGEPFAYVPHVYCFGFSSGLVLMSNPMALKRQDGWLVAHEIGHCRYLKHHEVRAGAPSMAPADHDLDDHNCIMSYPWGIAARPGLSWDKGDIERPRFCGKCALRLRGWNVTGEVFPPGSAGAHA